jgi:2'-5' RNA ligase
MARVIPASGGALRPIPPRSAHLTYAFVSAAPDDRLDALAAAIAAVAKRHEPFVIRLGTPHVLYARSEARLVCAPVTDGVPALSRLASDVVDALQAVLPAGAVSGGRSHHVTLARFRKKTHRSEARPVEHELERARAGVEPRGHQDMIARLQLMSSDLTPAGPVYTPIVDVALG